MHGSPRYQIYPDQKVVCNVFRSNESLSFKKLKQFRTRCFTFLPFLERTNNSSLSELFYQCFVSEIFSIFRNIISFYFVLISSTLWSFAYGSTNELSDIAVGECPNRPEERRTVSNISDGELVLFVSEDVPPRWRNPIDGKREPVDNGTCNYQAVDLPRVTFDRK